MSADQIVGERIHLELFRQRMTRRELARLLGVSEQSFGKKVNGHSTFTLDELLMVSRVLRVPVLDLLPGDDYDPDPGSGRGRGSVRVHRRQLDQPSGYPLRLVRAGGLDHPGLEVAA